MSATTPEVLLVESADATTSVSGTPRKLKRKREGGSGAGRPALPASSAPAVAPAGIASERTTHNGRAVGRNSAAPAVPGRKRSSGRSVAASASKRASSGKAKKSKSKSKAKSKDKNKAKSKSKSKARASSQRSGKARSGKSKSKSKVTAVARARRGDEAVRMMAAPPQTSSGTPAGQPGTDDPGTHSRAAVAALESKAAVAASSAAAAMGAASDARKREADVPRGYPLDYAHVNETFPPERFDVDGFTIKYSDFSQYKLREKIGEGAYSEVFVAKRKSDGVKVVAKQIKTEKETKAKLKRELLMLRLVSGCDRIVQWLDTVQDPVKGYKYFIFEFIENPNFRITFYRFNDLEARLYLYQLLLALDYTHSQGIIHRDVKPRNVLYNPVTRQLRLIDWGFGEFYWPGKPIEKWPGTRYYKAPELFFRYPYYDYAVDMWSYGCVVATLVFARMPMFKGREDSLSQLIEISKCLGTQGLHNYLQKYRIAIRSKFRTGIKKRKRRSWLHYRNPKHQEKCTTLGMDLVDKLLRWDHEHRLTARQALAHPFFDPVRHTDVPQHLPPLPASSTGSSSEYVYYYDDEDDAAAAN
ncbi:CMGC/CK2 protein kinase [Thecamonas trahens ATCC 50062]|uniref:non-specific serine/threonine protein kinase n=1 Tax=Thecamonas trahens ATCC 50062 TaxID=461836 RepID=A0A0L0D8C2_THETB|nr:CMGC/CK2 protein kinase [Thecamonas trahens ATCC 50062]KNC48607.1 CMGC/CK2 protein kinase [Thecamonas trahens ATCC 50062]|eukprot:XP_013762663.1 CMGC/CK2 protein kinase [Thecamonas trahens ATCC 50062]